jgi:four helix bundle protein
MGDSQFGNYRNLKVWQKSIILVEDIYRITRTFPAHENFGLVSQMNRSVVSIPSNIAEGQSRNQPMDFRRFLYYSLGSIAELDTQVIIAGRLGYISDEESNCLDMQITEIRKMLFGLIKKLAPTN